MASYPENSFARILWEQQLRTSCISEKQTAGPLASKWCIILQLISSAAHHTLDLYDCPQSIHLETILITVVSQGIGWI